MSRPEILTSDIVSCDASVMMTFLNANAIDASQRPQIGRRGTKRIVMNAKSFRAHTYRIWSKHVLDADMAQYIHDNTNDEFTHQHFLNAYLVSKGADPVSFEKFRILPGSSATGAIPGKLRITNLTQLTFDTSWWTRYRNCGGI
jgi:hypothetical protein